MAVFKLPEGYEIEVDDEDACLIHEYSWHAKPYRQRDCHYVYVEARVSIGHGKRKNLVLSRLILKRYGLNLTGLIVTYNDGNTLNLHRSNLYACTISQFRQNVNKCATPTSNYRGVSKHKFGGKWRATVGFKNHNYHLGVFPDEISAAKAYDSKVKELNYDHVELNFPR